LSALLLFGAGLALLIFSAELIVRHGSALALAFGVNPLILGLTIVAIGTSAPELAIGITAGLNDSGSLAVGNIAGTNLVNVLLILGLSALMKPLPLHSRTIRMDLPMMIFAATLMATLAWDGVLSTTDGIVMLLCAAAYTVTLIRQSQGESRAVKKEYKDMFGADGARTSGTEEKHVWVNAFYLAGGLALTVLGADWLVDGAVSIARALGWSEAVIGLTIVAIGTSAPELVTTIVGTLRNERDVAVGNLLGSSIYNLLVILGVPCLLAPGGIEVERQLLMFDIPLMTAVAFLCIPVFMTGRAVSRAEGGMFVGLYCAYLTWLLILR
jgi:cation:H+ antiporter